MTLTLEVTGDTVAESFLSSLILDDKNMLGIEYEGLRKIIAQVVRASNMLGKHVDKLRDDDEQLNDAVQHLEQQIASYEVRVRECEDTCQEVRLQIGTMIVEQQQKQPEPEIQATSEVSRKDLSEIMTRIDGLSRDQENARQTQQNDVEVLHRKCSEHEDTLNRHQDFFQDELEARLTQSDDDRVAIKSDLEAVRQALEDSNARKASKVEVNDLAHRLQELCHEHATDHQMLADAHRHFKKLDGLTDLVNENQSRMQESWAKFGIESQELREWAARNFNELRSAVRGKMNEEDGLSHVREIRRELRELAPFLSEAVTRVEEEVRHKADVSGVVKLQDGIDILHRQAGRTKQLLLGTKCLACDREIDSTTATDKGPVSLVERRQEEELWNEVQRTLHQQADPRGRSRDVLRYVAIHVGSPMRERDLAGKGIFQARDHDEQVPGGHYLMRTSGGAGAPLSRPQTSDGHERAAPREVPPLVRVPPRRPGRFGPPSGGTSWRRSAGNEATQNTTVRGALGARQGQPLLPKPPSTAPAAPETVNDDAMESYSPVRHQPAAQTGFAQPQATDFEDDLQWDSGHLSSGVLSPGRPTMSSPLGSVDHLP